MSDEQPPYIRLQTRAPEITHAAVWDASTGGKRVDRTWVLHEDQGRVSIQWPEGKGVVVVAAAVVEGWAEQINELRRELDTANATIAELRDPDPTAA